MLKLDANDCLMSIWLWNQSGKLQMSMDSFIYNEEAKESFDTS